MISPNIKELKGNAGMTLFGAHNDDVTNVLPNIGFDFIYNDINVRSAINISGNSWVGFGSATEHLLINRRDASYNNLYWIKEVEDNRPVFRIRWEGNSAYSSYGSNDLVWELTLYDDNAMVLVIQAIPKNGTDSFVSKGSSGTITCNFQATKSYVFFPTVVGGKSYIVQEGSYKIITQVFLMDDGGNGLKGWDGSTWTKVADPPVTEDIMKANGIAVLPSSRNGLILTNPSLLMWTDNLSEVVLRTRTTGIPTPKLIIQTSDYSIPAGINTVVITVNLTGSSVIKIVCSIDQGFTWKAWNGSWISVDVSAISNVKNTGMIASVLNGITAAQWATLGANYQELRFAYYMEQAAKGDICNIDKIRVNYK
ncbi:MULTISPECIES: hypothetical protein [Clostridium]|uniref:Uncharacterized protein n=1 Tax=Clostridium frigoriphilum TaxID=443253 RepID=A0ABU7UPZ8_9CLOT|nr:hypothetical protein [Clostridium sp. DSM 17811]MBU3100657.1 hypothetical protein [Clostridium sp. DSM 17811]